MESTNTAHYRDLLKGVFGGRSWISTSDILISAAAQAEQLLDLGASSALAIGASRGTGELPDPAFIPQIDLGSSGVDMMSAIRAAQDALANVSDEVRRRIDGFDPDHLARAIGSFVSDGRPVGGRRMFGARPLPWQLLEDKTRHEILWDQAGIPFAAARVVVVELDALRRARDEVAGGGDVVLAGDSREGFNGGGSYLRWIRDERQLAEAVDWYSTRCDFVRVMPFLEGLPCSIHGIVFPEYVASLRPFEMIVLREPEVPRFAYTGTASFWDAPEALEEEMRGIARRVGNTLRETLGYRGAFTVDGVATSEGFRPTELNPRFGAALSRATRTWNELPLYLLNLALVEGLELDYRPRHLEKLVCEYLAKHRGGGMIRVLKQRVEESSGAGLCRDAGGWRPAAGDEPTDARYALGPGPVGGTLRLILDPNRTPRGPSTSARVAELFGFLGKELGLGLGEMEPAAEADTPDAPHLA